MPAEVIYAKNVTTLTVGGTAAAPVGRIVLMYIIQTDGVNDATLTFTRNGAGGGHLWKDTCVGADLAKPGTLPAIDPDTGDWMYATLTGTGATCDIHWG